MKNINHIIILFISFFCWTSCADKKEVTDNVSFDTIYVTDTLTEMDSSDLSPILEMIGDAKIIGLSESGHFMNEPLDFRNELIKFLVREKRIDVIVIESGIVESRHLFDYVNGGKENIDSALFNGISWTFDKLPQNKELVEWLRKYNENTTNPHKVKLYGYDIPGSPLNPFANQKLNGSIKKVLGFLKVVDKDEWLVFSDRLKPLIDYVDMNISDPNYKQYVHLGEIQRNELTGIINDLIKLFELNEISYKKQSSKENYDWAYLAATSSREIDDWLRSIPLDLKLSADVSETVFSDFFWDLHHKRDQTMANNVEWIRSREENCKMLLFGHLNHISKAGQTIVTSDSTRLFKHEQLGQYLDSRYQADYKVIGNFQYTIKRQNGATHADEDAFEKCLIQQNNSNYYRLLSEKDKPLMNKEWKIGETFLNAKTYMNPYQGVDILFFTPTQTEIVVK